MVFSPTLDACHLQQVSALRRFFYTVGLERRVEKGK